MARDNTAPRPVQGEHGAEFLACPFCASTNLGLFEQVCAQQFSVKCNLCGGEGPKRSTPEEAGRLWNRRVQA